MTTQHKGKIWTMFKLHWNKMWNELATIDELQITQEKKLADEPLTIDKLAYLIRTLFSIETELKQIYNDFTRFKAETSFPVVERNIVKILKQINKRIKHINNFIVIKKRKEGHTKPDKKISSLKSTLEELWDRISIQKNIEIYKYILIILGTFLTLFGLVFVALGVLPALGFEVDLTIGLIFIEYQYLLILIGIAVFISGQLIATRIIDRSYKQLMLSLFGSISVAILDLAIIGVLQDNRFHISDIIFFGPFYISLSMFLFGIFLLSILFASLSFLQAKTPLNVVTLAVFTQITMMFMCLAEKLALAIPLWLFITMTYVYLWIIILISFNDLLTFFVILGNSFLFFTPITSNLDYFVPLLPLLAAPSLSYFIIYKRDKIDAKIFDIPVLKTKLDGRFQQLIFEWSFGVTALSTFALLYIYSLNVPISPFSEIKDTLIIIIFWGLLVAQNCFIIIKYPQFQRGILVSLLLMAIAWGPFAGLLDLTGDIFFSIAPWVFFVFQLLVYWQASQLELDSLAKSTIINEWTATFVVLVICIALGPFHPLSYGLYLTLAPLTLYIGLHTYKKGLKLAWLAPISAIFLAVGLKAHFISLIIDNVNALLGLGISYFVLLSYLNYKDMNETKLRSYWYQTIIMIIACFLAIILLIPTAWAIYIPIVDLLIVLIFVSFLLNRNIIEQRTPLAFSFLLPLLGIPLNIGSSPELLTPMSWFLAITLATVLTILTFSSVPSVKRTTISYQNIHDVFMLSVFMLNVLVVSVNPAWPFQIILFLSIPLLEWIFSFFSPNSVNRDISKLLTYILQLTTFLGINQEIWNSPVTFWLPILILVCTYFMFLLLDLYDSSDSLGSIYPWLRPVLYHTDWIAVATVIGFFGTGIYLQSFNALDTAIFAFIFLILACGINFIKHNKINLIEWLVLGSISYLSLYLAYSRLEIYLNQLLVDSMILLGLGSLFGFLSLVTFQTYISQPKYTSSSLPIIFGVSFAQLILVSGITILIEFVTLQSFQLITGSLTAISIVATLLIIGIFLLRGTRFLIKTTLKSIHIPSFIFLASTPLWIGIGFLITSMVLQSYNLTLNLSIIDITSVLLLLGTILVFTILHAVMLLKSNSWKVTISKVLSFLDVTSLMLVTGALLPVFFNWDYRTLNISVSTIATTLFLIVTISFYRLDQSKKVVTTTRPVATLLLLSGTISFVSFQLIFPMSALFTLWWFILGGLTFFFYHQTADQFHLNISFILFGLGTVKLLYETSWMLLEQSIDLTAAFNLIIVGILLLSLGYQQFFIKEN